MNNNLTPARDKGREGAGAVALTWIEDVYTRTAPARLGGQPYEEQEKAAWELAQKHDIRLLLILTCIGNREDVSAAGTVAGLVNAVYRHNLHCVLIPSRDWISENQEVISWFEAVLKSHNVTLITKD